MSQSPLVGIILGSKSDLPAFEGCTELLDDFGVPFELVVHSAHRTPDAVRAWALEAEGRGMQVLIAGAGKAAALGGVVAAHTSLPVIGVPCVTSDLGGMDSLLSTVQMPTGVPIATVAIGGARNAAVLATQMLGVAYPEYRERIREYKARLAQG